jgi:hypothetical protein
VRGGSCLPCRPPCGPARKEGGDNNGSQASLLREAGRGRDAGLLGASPKKGAADDGGAVGLEGRHGSDD